MGRWAQSKRRGGRQAGLPGLAPPPPPELSEFEGELFQDAEGGDDTGGQCRLYTSPTGSNPWSLNSAVEWQSVQAWGDRATWEGFWVRATEVGNGLAYVGESAPSNALQIE